MSSSAKQQERRREELKATALERLGLEDARRIRFLIGQIRDSEEELTCIFRPWAARTIISFGELDGTKGLTATPRTRQRLRPVRTVPEPHGQARQGRSMEMTRKDKIILVLWLASFAAAILLALWGGMWLAAGIVRAGVLSLTHLAAFLTGLIVAAILGAPLDGGRR